MPHATLARRLGTLHTLLSSGACFVSAETLLAMSQNPYSPNWQDGMPKEPTAPRRPSHGCWWAALVLGCSGMLVLCCGGGAGVVYFGMGIMAEEIKILVRDDPVLREHLGEVQRFETDWMASAAEPDDDTYVYQVQGTKGSGELRVKSITDDEGDEQVISAKLRLKDGTEVQLDTE